jgi:phosphoribosylformimino-5-aminoimidazole carboxamide ribotide isomerase
MIIAPAIDIRGGKCVRLVQGDYDRETVFGDDPAAMAEKWAASGAEVLHLVDLDGAKSGRSDNAAAVQEILRRFDAIARAATGATDGTTESAKPVTELGGGIRDIDAAARWLDLGIDRVILGTVAVTDPQTVVKCVERFGSRIWVGIDARKGKVAVSGWTEGTDREATDLAREVEEIGAGGIIYTDIDRDGTGKGVNAEATAKLATSVRCPVFASGGVHSTEDVTRLLEASAAQRRSGGRDITGVVVGRALYDGTVTLGQLLAAAATRGDGGDVC